MYVHTHRGLRKDRINIKKLFLAGTLHIALQPPDGKPSEKQGLAKVKAFKNPVSPHSSISYSYFPELYVTRQPHHSSYFAT